LLIAKRYDFVEVTSWPLEHEYMESSTKPSKEENTFDFFPSRSSLPSFLSLIFYAE
jgi:hypothetical protein